VRRHAGPPLAPAVQQDEYVRLGYLFGRQGNEKWRTRSDPVRGRGRALREEVDYWHQWLATKGGKWGDDYNHRFDPSAEVADPALREVVAKLPGDRAAILDVGSGPVSTVGYRFPGKTITLVPVDPLADEYDRLLAKTDVRPPVRATREVGEHLLKRFGLGRFDIAYARNAIDHAVDPLLIVENMIAVVRQGGYVVLRHVRNEGVRQDYVQLHQWNFDRRENHFIAWRPSEEINVSAALRDVDDIRCSIEPGSETEPVEWIVCTLRKKSR